MTRNDKFRRRLGRQINVRHDHDVGRCVRLDIIMQQIFTRLCCEDAVDKTVILLNLSCMRLEKHVAVLDSWRFCKKPCKRHRRRSSLQVATCRRTDQLHPATVGDDVRNTVVEKNPTQGRVVRDKAWFFIHPPSHVEYQFACFSCQF